MNGSNNKRKRKRRSNSINPPTTSNNVNSPIIIIDDNNTSPQFQSSSINAQIEADEKYARELQEEYENEEVSPSFHHLMNLLPFYSLTEDPNFQFTSNEDEESENDFKDDINLFSHYNDDIDNEIDIENDFPHPLTRSRARLLQSQSQNNINDFARARIPRNRNRNIPHYRPINITAQDIMFFFNAFPFHIGFAEHRGLTDSQINRFPTSIIKHLSKYETCAICMEEMGEGSQVRRLPCMHYFHIKCIDPWIKSSASCPIDRKNFERME